MELVHHLRASDTKAVIVEPPLLKTLHAAASELGLSSDRILVFDNKGEEVPSGFRSWKWLFGHGEVDWPKFSDLETAQRTAAALLFSSGTTGMFERHV